MQILRIIVYYKNYEYPIVFTARTIDSLDIIKSVCHYQPGLGYKKDNAS